MTIFETEETLLILQLRVAILLKMCKTRYYSIVHYVYLWKWVRGILVFMPLQINLLKF